MKHLSSIVIFWIVVSAFGERLNLMGIANEDIQVKNISDNATNDQRERVLNLGPVEYFFNDVFQGDSSQYDSSGGPTMKELNAFIQSFKPALMYVTDLIEKMVNHSALLKTRLIDAATLRKELDFGKKDLEDATDIMEMRLTCQTITVALRIKDLISQDTEHFGVLETKCYGMCPGAGLYGESGYRGIHMNLEIKDHNKTIKLEIGTPYTDMWAKWNRDLVKSDMFKDSIAKTQYALKLADYFLELDETRDKLPACPKQLRDADFKSVVKKIAGSESDPMYEDRGYPPNGCFWWNDMKATSTGRRIHVLFSTWTISTTISVALKYLILQF